LHAFQHVINLHYGLTAPDDPQKRQMHKVGITIPENVEMITQALNELIWLYTIPLCCLGGVCLILCLVSFIASYYFYTQIQTYRQEARNLQASVKLYQQTSKGLILIHCELPDKTDQVCIEINQNY